MTAIIEFTIAVKNNLLTIHYMFLVFQLALNVLKELVLIANNGNTNKIEISNNLTILVYNCAKS